MIHMPHFLRLAKNNLHLELGVGCLYSASCREGLFPETELPAYGVLGNSVGARG